MSKDERPASAVAATTNPVGDAKAPAEKPKKKEEKDQE